MNAEAANLPQAIEVQARLFAQVSRGNLPARIGNQHVCGQRIADKFGVGSVQHDAQRDPATGAVVLESLDQAAGDQQIAEIARGVDQDDAARLLGKSGQGQVHVPETVADCDAMIRQMPEFR